MLGSSHEEPRVKSFIHDALSKALLAWGSWVMNRNSGQLKALIFLPMIIAAVFTAGVAIMNREERPEYLWLVENDWVLQDRTYRQS